MKEEVILYTWWWKKRKKKEQLGFLRSPDCVCVYTVCIYTHTPCSRILNHIDYYKYIVHFFFFFSKNNILIKSSLRSWERIKEFRHRYTHSFHMEIWHNNRVMFSMALALPISHLFISFVSSDVRIWNAWKKKKTKQTNRKKCANLLIL